MRHNRNNFRDLLDIAELVLSLGRNCRAPCSIRVCEGWTKVKLKSDNSELTSSRFRWFEGRIIKLRIHYNEIMGLFAEL